MKDTYAAHKNTSVKQNIRAENVPEDVGDGPDLFFLKVMSYTDVGTDTLCLAM